MNDVPIDKLGAFPLLQLAMGILVVVGFAFALYSGRRDRRPSDAISSEQRYFFDGPVGEALKLLRDIRNIANETKEHIEPLGELGRNTNRELGEIKDQVQSLKEIKARPRR